MKIRLVTACIAAALAGCTVGPNYVRPAVETPAAWRIDYERAADVANTRWWEQFGDAVLDGLVDTALRNNRDLRIAAARVDQFIGVLTSTGAQLYPQIGYGADATRARATVGEKLFAVVATGTGMTLSIRIKKFPDLTLLMELFFHKISIADNTKVFRK